MKTPPRGVRNNNPFNLEKGTQKWQGLSVEQTDPKFCMFDTAVLGIRAGMRDLIAAQDQHELRTVFDIMQRFAPAGDNDTVSYVTAVCEHMGVGSHDVLDMHAYSDLRSFSEAIIEHENGGLWSTWYTDTQMVKACVMAGVEPPKKSLMVAPQVIGSSIAATATVAAPVVQTIQDQLQPLTDYSHFLKHAFLIVALIGIALTAWAKFDERKKGIS